MTQDAAAFLSYWANARSRTLRVLEALEPEDLDWAPAPGAFSFGDLFRHLAGLERGMWAATLEGPAWPYLGHQKELAPDKAALRAYVARLHAESMAIFGRLTDADMAAPCVAPTGTMATWKWLRAMAEHEAHHRGQLYLMASLRGRQVAPLFGLTAEELAQKLQRP
jgi:uncharacterized damage-inducible protein DinB